MFFFFFVFWASSYSLFVTPPKQDGGTNGHHFCHLSLLFYLVGGRCKLAASPGLTVLGTLSHISIAGYIVSVGVVHPFIS